MEGGGRPSRARSGTASTRVVGKRTKQRSRLSGGRRMYARLGFGGREAERYTHPPPWTARARRETSEREVINGFCPGPGLKGFELPASCQIGHLHTARSDGYLSPLERRYFQQFSRIYDTAPTNEDIFSTQYAVRSTTNRSTARHTACTPPLPPSPPPRPSLLNVTSK